MIQTTRCELSALQTSDLDHIVQLYADKNVRRFLGGPVDAQTTMDRFPTMLETTVGSHHWVIRAKKSGAFIGIVALETHHNGRNTELSYQLLPEWWGKGYATEGVQAILTFALTDLGLTCVIAETQAANSKSCRLLERIGMHPLTTIERFGAKQIIYST